MTILEVKKGWFPLWKETLSLFRPFPSSGWMSGTVLRTGESGLVPSSFVQQYQEPDGQGNDEDNGKSSVTLPEPEGKGENMVPQQSGDGTQSSSVIPSEPEEEERYQEPDGQGNDEDNDKSSVTLPEPEEKEEIMGTQSSSVIPSEPEEEEIPQSQPTPSIWSTLQAQPFTPVQFYPLVYRPGFLPSILGRRVAVPSTPPKYQEPDGQGNDEDTGTPSVIPSEPEEEEKKQCYMALYDYPGGEKGMVSFVEGDIILVQAISPSGWMSGTVLRTGESGLLPSCFVQQYQEPDGQGIDEDNDKSSVNLPEPEGKEEIMGTQSSSVIPSEPEEGEKPHSQPTPSIWSTQQDQPLTPVQFHPLVYRPGFSPSILGRGVAPPSTPPKEPDGWNDDKDSGSPSVIFSEPEEEKEQHYVALLDYLGGEEVPPHEKDLCRLCWVPFGIQTLKISPVGDGHTYKLQPNTVGCHEEDLIRLEVPKDAINTDVCKELSIHYGILVHGPFVLEEDYELASMVVYIDFNVDHTTKPLMLRLPHWASEGEATNVAVAPHKVDKTEQYKFANKSLLSLVTGSIPIFGHCSLFAKAVKVKSQKFYYAHPLESHKDTEAKLSVYFTYASTVWSEIIQCHVAKCASPSKFELGNKDKLNAVLEEDRGSGWEADFIRNNVITQGIICYNSNSEDDLKKDVCDLKSYPPFIQCMVQCTRKALEGGRQRPVKLVFNKTHHNAFMSFACTTFSEEPIGGRASSEPPSFVSNGTPPARPQGIITDTADFLPYLDMMTPHLTLLGAVLGIDDLATAIVNGPGDPQAKCLKTLKKWMDVTPNLTWDLFCEKLGKSSTFNSLRSRITEDNNTSGRS